MDNTLIRAIALQVKDEADAIVQYTDNIQSVAEDNDTQDIFNEIRNDELGHLQKLVIALSEVMVGNEPTEAEQMDGGDDNAGDT